MAFTETTNPSRAKKIIIMAGKTLKITSIDLFTRQCLYQMSDFIVVQILIGLGTWALMMKPVI